MTKGDSHALQASFRVFGAALVLAAAVASGTTFAKPPRLSPGTATPQAVAQTLGMAIMSAFVSATGELIEGAGAVSSVRDSTGQYTVRFNRGLAGCMSTATQWGFTASIISVWPQVDTVKVFTSVPASGAPANKDFQLIVFCSK